MWIRINEEQAKAIREFLSERKSDLRSEVEMGERRVVVANRAIEMREPVKESWDMNLYYDYRDSALIDLREAQDELKALSEEIEGL